MHPTRLVPAAVLSLLIAACADPGRLPTAPSAAPSLAAADVIRTRERAELSGTVLDPCNQQPVRFTAGVDRHSVDVLNGNRNNIAGRQVISNVKGLGEDGTRYVGSQVDGYTGQYDVDGGTVRLRLGFRLVSAGPRDNFIVRGYAQLAVDAEGNETVVLDQVTAECRG